MRWINHMLARYRLLRDMSELINWQAEVIRERNIQIEQLLQIRLQDQLEAQRAYLDLVVTVRRAIDEPELAENLEGMMTDVADFIARLEEQIVI